MPDRDATVVVVGAGLSGLVAARDLERAGVDVLVVESADRIGGRTLRETSVLGSRLDLGGQWIGHDHRRVMALADELGLTRYPMHTGLLPRLVDGPRRVSPLGPAMLVAGLALAGLALLARVGAPARWNSSTLDTWLRRVPGRTARRLLEVAALVSWTADPNRLSVHAMARMVRAQHGLRTMLSTRGGAQDSLLVEGVGELAVRLAAGLRRPVRLGHRVTAIARDGAGVTVRTTSGELRAAKVIVTVPAPVADRIAHEPPLPPERVAAGRDSYMGSVYKAVAVYQRPFWRERGGGELFLLGEPGGAVFDSTAPDGPGHLVVLVGGPEARALDHLDPAARRAAILGPLAAHLGPEVLEPAGWHEKSWHLDEHAGGGYMALPRAGTSSGLLPMPAAPVGDLHWAGTETATDHPGYLDGAIEAGERAAREVVGALRGAVSAG